MKLVYASEMQALDHYTIEECGIPGLVLMENAGRGIAELILSRFAQEASQGVVIVCGPGNNGGDGFVVARHLFQKGYPLKVFSLTEEEKFKGDAQVNLKIIKNMGLPLYFLTTDDLSPLEEALSKNQIIVDAIFGTGLSREVSGRFAKAIELINKSQKIVVSVDMPSGLSADTGRPLGIAVKATVCATMALPKVGQLIYPGKDYVGELEIIDISMPAKIIAEKGPARFCLDVNWACETIKPRPQDSHKGTYGHVAVLAGSQGKTGAAILSCQGALRGGAGLVTLVCPKSLNHIFETTLVEAMTFPLPKETPIQSLSYRAFDQIISFMVGKKAVALGPGFGLHPETFELVHKLVAQVELPMVVDADALSATSGEPYHLRRSQAPRVITPHPGELSRLLDVPKEEIQEDRLLAARAAAKETNAVVVLKGAATVIVSPDGREAVNTTGNPGLASGGSGDVLTGLIASLLGQGYEAFSAACLGVFLHGYAADILAKRKGPWGYTAQEVAETIPLAIKELLVRKEFGKN
ncbi:bifunctional ADP-dependent NAD(P)H-hydrate dehydratase/NAD(P)H-hydrate epimerase [Thermodesulfatator atlanticus]|uniref:bifunctional ADP-dependent NAD(P)H-hydrate dehydratase/NAD(P)H-hydrate epimerase n=1 Tax=Thermodesulfatator atlanticus TaxID=501497 RepID=UPI0003B7B211|nr:bifunctional ADP-dependent NAD(P)H-hydrate dehydratase/NAD(P)H-hydrate epimerase [Thermodesulfatator atlanticus]